jgi:NAD(P)-dependent dehydrogenase (short-subunit alcohol dehydrogenase family)
MRSLNKNIIVTGAGAGMGREITMRFLKEGANVLGVDRNQSALNQLIADVQESEGTLVTYTGDISTRDANEKMIQLALDHFGSLDILVINAGVAGNNEPIAEVSDESWNRIMNVDVTGPMYAMRKAVQVFSEQEKGGLIIAITSVAGYYGCRASVAYTAAKHALVGLCEHTAFTYMHQGIRCNMVAPGAIKTGMSAHNGQDSALGRERVLAGMDPHIPIGSTSDIASAVLFLASDEASFINGATLVVDGGVSCN